MWSQVHVATFVCSGACNNFYNWNVVIQFLNDTSHYTYIVIYNICANIYVHIILLSCCICSSWAVLKPEELKRTLSSWRKTLDEGKADDFIKRCEEHRMQIGSSMSIVGYKWTSENKCLARSFVNWLIDHYRFLLIVVYGSFPILIMHPTTSDLLKVKLLFL